MTAAAAAAVSEDAGGAADAGGILHAALKRGEWTSQVGGRSCLPLAACYPGMDSLPTWACGVGVQLPPRKEAAVAVGGTCSNCGWRAACHPGGKRNLKSRIKKKILKDAVQRAGGLYIPFP